MEMTEFTLVLMRAVRDFVQPALDGLSKRISAVQSAVDGVSKLESRVTAIEQRGVHFRGTHQRGQKYAFGDLVVSDGSLWACVANTSEEPGKSAHWALAAKRGRDGKDVR